MRELIIESEQQRGKGRSFHGALLASVEADPLWEGGRTQTDNLRPVWAMFVGSEQELKPFVTNLLLGKKACTLSNSYSRRKGERVELLKSAGYQVSWQREVEGTIATVHLPDLFRLDPGMVDPKGITFVILPSQDWLSRQKIEQDSIVKHIQRFEYPIAGEELPYLIPLAFLFAAYLDRRTRCPLYSDGRFYLQLMLACLEQGLASWPTPDDYYGYRDSPFGQHHNFGFHQHDTDDAGLTQGIAFHAKHEELERVLAEQVEIFFDKTAAPVKTKRRGKGAKGVEKQPTVEG